MALKTLVKVGKVSNLSDARYCAGMGVDMLGFCVVEGQEQYISPVLYKEIRGWFSGPQVVAEVYGAASEKSIQHIIENYLPDLIELSLNELRVTLPGGNSKYILFVDDEAVSKHLDEIMAFKNQIKFLLAPGNIDSLVLKKLSDDFKIILQADSVSDINIALENNSFSGINLKGSTEERPGFKSYAQLSEIFEMLEIEH